jgi:hypothetical protein
MWAIRSPVLKLTSFEYDPTRKRKVIDRILGKDFEGVIQTDGYYAYSSFDNDCDHDPDEDGTCDCSKRLDGKDEVDPFYLAFPDLIPKAIRVGCLAHIRRKFFDIVESIKKSGKKKHGTIAHQAVALIKKIYKIEEKLELVSNEERATERQKQIRPLFDLLLKLVNDSNGKVPERSSMGKAIAYARKQLPSLEPVFQNGALKFDNNGIENAMRPIALGRKNWLFADTVEGAEVSAILYSLIHSAKENEIDPYTYLTILFTRLAKAKILDDYLSLLPHRIKF